MTNRQFVVALGVGILIGCAGSQITHVATVDAQPADPGRFRECVVYTLEQDGDLEDLPSVAKSIEGWTPVGGSGGNGVEQAVVLCR